MLSNFDQMFETSFCRRGDIALLSVEAVVNPTSEGLSDKNPISLRLQEVAGPDLKEECRTQIISESFSSQCIIFYASNKIRCREGLKWRASVFSFHYILYIRTYIRMCP